MHFGLQFQLTAAVDSVAVRLRLTRTSPQKGVAGQICLSDGSQEA